MGLSAANIWEVRTTGSDGNGGLWQPLQPSAGTDYSQQNAAQLSLSDIVTVGNTTVTSVTGGFTNVMVGNGINIDGTCYMIATFGNTNTITVDRIIGAGTGRTGNVGGALATPGYCMGQISAAADVIYIKSGAYTISSDTANVANGLVQPAGYCYINGYQTTRGDNGTKPVLTASGIASAAIIYLPADKSYVNNISVDGASLAGIVCFNLSSSSVVENCNAANGAAGSFTSNSSGSCRNCAATGGGGTAAFLLIRHCFRCVAYANTVPGFSNNGGGSWINCLSIGNTGGSSHGFAVLTASGVAGIYNCTSYGNGGHGFSVNNGAISSPPAFIENCLAVGNGAYGFGATAAVSNTYLQNCAGYNNTSGNVNTTNIPTGMYNQGFVTLSANPLTNTGLGDYSLNAVAGGGAACRAAGVPGSFGSGFSPIFTTGYLDIGAVQHADPAGTSGMLYLPNLAGV